MSRRNGRAKQLEKQLSEAIWKLSTIEKEQQEHDKDLLNLQEENSDLRRLIDEQNDYIKEQFKIVQNALTEHYQFQKYLNNRLTDEALIRRQSDNCLRARIADIPIPRGWVGRQLFK